MPTSAPDCVASWLAVKPLGQSEVGDVRLALLVHQHVCRLQVAVQDAALMGVMHGLSHSRDQPGGSARIAGEFLEPPVEAGPVHQLHAEEMLPAALAYLVDRHDVRVIELGDGLRLVLKPNQLGFRCEAARLDHLQGDGPVERDLVGFEDHAHPAAP